MTGVTVVTFIVIGSSIAAAQDGIDRFQQMDMATGTMAVIDTATGGLWVATKSTQGDHYLKQVCYLGPNGYLMPTPYEDHFVDDLTVFESICAPDR